MRGNLSRAFAGILAAILLFSSGSSTVFAGTNPRYGKTMVITTEPYEEEAADPEGDEGKEEESLPEDSQPSDVNEPSEANEPFKDETDRERTEQNEPEPIKTEQQQRVLRIIDPEEKTSTAPQGNPVEGAVEVQIFSGLEVLKEQKFNVMLSKKDGSAAVSKEATLLSRQKEDEEAPKVSVRFPNLSEETYILEIAGQGYITYRQEIKVEKLGYRVQVYTGSVPQLAEGNNRPGLMLYGDVDNNQTLDDKDGEIIVKAIESGEPNEDCDLNGDGVVDLLDLNYFTTMEGSEKQESALEKLIPEEAVASSVAKNTTVQNGDLRNLLNDESGSVTFAPTGGERISKESPVVVDFDFTASEPVGLDGVVIHSPRKSENAIEEGQLLIRYEEGGAEKYEFADFSAPAELRLLSAPNYVKNNNISVKWDKSGALCIDLGSQIAIKHVTLKITKTAKSTNLAEISRVEFLNDMESRIPEPSADIPVGLKAVPGNKSFTVSWNRAQNVTGYEVFITSEGKTDYRKTTATQLTITQFANDKLKNGTEYVVKVRSTNGEWKSGYGTEEKVIPKASSKPSAPDNLSVKGGYRSMDVRWKKAEDADSYNIYWKEDGAAQFQKITGIGGLYYQIGDLKDNTKYIVYVTATNELGEGPKSGDASDKTISGLIDAKLPAYRLINTSNGNGVLSSHITAASIGGGAYMVDSSLDTEKDSALGLFDNNYASYVYREDWDYGGAYPSANKGIVAELDKAYDLGMIAFAEPMDLGDYSYFTVQYWDENGVKQTVKNASLLKKRSGSRNYYLIKFKEPVRTSKLQLGVGRYNGGLRKVTISEMRFYEYDSIEQDIMNLYADDLHISLRDNVTVDTIDELQKRLDTKDPVSKEYHPERNALQKELDAAKELLETGGLGGVLQVNPDITSKKDKEISVGGLNAWQPLGVTAGAEDKLVVYVGHPGKKEGASTDLSLVFTQQHAESGSLSSAASLKIGRNEITVPKICSTDKERGGALYIQYTGNNEADSYAVRVSGGSSYPVLRLYGASKEEQAQRIRTYVEELKVYVSGLNSMHQELHDGSENENVKYTYNEKECVLNLTDIQTDRMLFSLPASQVLAGLGENSGERLSGTVQAMGDMMTLFYQHKGLTNSFAEGTSSSIIAKNHLPYQYLNIRYMKMFAGAFMYAAGNHIGIEWDQTSGMMGGIPVVSDERGRYQSGRYYGWGIAHEIGHEINQGAYAHAEVTNNYFSVLAQAQDKNSTVRFRYPEVFKKVTSGTEGYAGNVFTQLGMYWQLHLAYDRDYNYKTYETYQDTFEHLFFARVDSYARDQSRAPKPGGVALSLDGGRDQNFMRLASAAAEKDLSEFFIRWGMKPDTATMSYIKQFEPEKRAIYYVDDTARVYEMSHGAGDTFAGKQVASATASANNSEVTLSMSFTGDPELLQGYEIVRVFVEEGKERRETAGFTQTDTFTDQVAFAANHVIHYEVTAVDKYMNRALTCKAGSVKIKGDGLQDKNGWTVSTNMISAEDKKPDGTEESPCESDTISAVSKVIDNNKTTVFTGKTETEDPYILLELNRLTEVSALEYVFSGSGQPASEYKIEISEDGQIYREVRSGTFKQAGGQEMIYFTNGQDNWVCTYDAAYVRLTAVGQNGKNISVAELNLYGPSGDNVEFLSTQGGQKAMGILKSDYSYGKNEKIAKGSVVFTGSYKGNPAYNVVVLYDENGNIVGGTGADGTLTAHQVILADDPKDALLGDTSEGTWIYWITPSEEGSLPQKVRAELYRVDNALTNEGQRLVSDTEFVTVPQTLPEITLGGSGN